VPLGSLGRIFNSWEELVPGRNWGGKAVDEEAFR